MTKELSLVEFYSAITHGTDDERRAILRKVNAFDDLVAALRLIAQTQRSTYSHDYMQGVAEATLLKWTGERQ